MKQKKQIVPLKSQKQKVLKKTKSEKLQKKISKKILIGIGILFISLFIIVIFSTQQQHLQGNASQITPSYAPLGSCQSNGDCPSSSPSPSGGQGISISPGTSSAPSTAPSGNAITPCTSSSSVGQTTALHHRGGGSGGGNNSGGIMQLILQFFQFLLQLLQQLLGGGTISLPGTSTLSPSPSSGTQPSGTPSTAPSQSPCPPSTSGTPSGSQTQPSNGATSPAPSSGSSSGGTGTTTTTCSGNGTGGSVSTSGYTMDNCEDFNETGLAAGTLPSGWSAYNENGTAGSTTVGTGRTPSQCAVANGVVTLTQNSAGATCGMASSFGQQYGLWEARMRAFTTGSDSGSAPHPVLILWPDSNVWPSGGEYDYAEADIGSSMNAYFHCATSSGGNCATATSSVDFSQWHNYAIKWTATSVTGYIDGQQWITTTDSQALAPGSMHQTIQLDNLSGSTPVDPGQMQVDWVHVYKAN